MDEAAVCRMGQPRMAAASDRVDGGRDYTVAAAAQAAGVAPHTLWRWTDRGVRGRKLPSRMHGGRRVVHGADLRRFLGLDREEPAPAPTPAAGGRTPAERGRAARAALQRIKTL